jgi:Sulfatase-modifying factor enzyme 1
MLPDIQPFGPRPSVIVSLRYGAGDQLERAFSKVLANEGFSVFLHTLTADRMKRAHPLLVHDNGLQILTYESATREPESNSNVFRPELFIELILAVGQHAAAIIVWSEEYKHGFWSWLEQNTLMAMAKPMVIVRVDDEPIEGPLAQAAKTGRVPVFEIDKAFRPSQVVAELSRRISSLRAARVLGLEFDALPAAVFARIEHPLLGPFEISSHPLRTSAVTDLSLLPGMRDGHEPVRGVAWETASQICAAFSERSLSYQYRLPSQAEWEVAVRAGSKEIEVPDGINLWGISYGMGNLGEWCAEDAFWEEADGRVSRFTTTADRKAVRGLRIADRPETRSPSYPGSAPSRVAREDITFRLVREIKRSS